jgi:hypothetical protein
VQLLPIESCQINQSQYDIKTVLGVMLQELKKWAFEIGWRMAAPVTCPKIVADRFVILEWLWFRQATGEKNFSCDLRPCLNKTKERC